MRSTELLRFFENRIIGRKYRGVEKTALESVFGPPSRHGGKRSIRQIAPNKPFAWGYRALENVLERAWRSE